MRKTSRILLATILCLCLILTLFTQQVYAADSTLCSGYSFAICTNAGYTAHGYENNNHTMYWKAYAASGHNCTNYVGYMLTLNGDSGPGVLMGDAHEWDDKITSNPQWGYTVNQTPAEGSVALWEGGEFGHVAYVEEVVNANTIKISEDNFSSGPFRWRIVTKTGDWPDKFLHIKDIGTERISTLTTNGSVWVKEGGLSSLWTLVENNASAVSLGGTMMGALLQNGDFKVKEGVGDQWQIVSQSTSKGFLTDDRIAVLTTTGELKVKEGAISAQWVTVDYNVIRAAISDDRIATIRTDGTLHVKEGAITAAWQYLENNAAEISVSKQRVGVVLGDGSFRVKEGALSSGWVILEFGVAGGLVTNNRVGVVKANGVVQVKSALYDSWTNVETGATALAMSIERIGVLTNTGIYRVKDGPISAPWSDLQLNTIDGALSYFVE